jgi:hypothetical protein
MWAGFRTGYAELLTSAGHLALLLVTWQIGTPGAWASCLALIAAVSFFAWAANLRRNRAVADTPTSSIASAAQGYAEIYGRTCDGAEYLAEGKLGSLPCIWYRYVSYRKSSDDKWVECARGVSESLFGVDDGTGRVLVDPDRAEVITTHRPTWYEGDYKHVEEQLLPSDRIYVLGEFATIGGAGSDLSLKDDVTALLAEWKNNQPQLLERFDLDRDGRVDLQEWELARRAARREVEKQHREIRQQPGVHVMRAPADGRHYLIANLSPQQLNRKYVLWGWIHLVTFLAAGGAAGWWAVVKLAP